MRILLMVHQFLPEHVAGTELVALDVAKGLTARGHQVEIFTGFPVKRALADAERFDGYEFEGLKVHRFSHQFVPMGGQTNIVELEYDNRLFADHLRGFLKAQQFGRGDVVHFFHMGRLGVGAVDACLERGVVTCFTPTDFWGICPFSQLRLPDGKLCGGPDVFAANCVRHAAEVRGEGKLGLLKVLPDVMVAGAARGICEGVVAERWFSDFVRALTERPEFVRQRLNKMDAILPPSRFMLEMLGRNGVHVSRMKYLPHGVNAAGVRRNVLRGGGGEKLRVGFLGTLVEHKGVHVLVEAVKMLPGDAGVEVHVHGKVREFPAYAERLTKMIGDDERFIFHGPYAPERIGEVLESVDLVVVPSLWYENSPLVIQAAQAAGCPVVASNAGGMVELVLHQKDGILFEMGNVAELAEVILGLARNRSEVRRLAENSPAVKSVGRYVKELEELYRVLAHGRKK